MNEKEKYRKIVLDDCREHGDIGPLEDGFQYFWSDNRGAMSAVALRIIADELDRLNAEWKDQIEQYFREEAMSRLLVVKTEDSQ